MTIKPKSKTNDPKSKQLKTSKPTHSTSRKDAEIISEFEKQLIKDLYKFASKGKSKAEIVLAELESSEEYKAKIKLLDKLKKQKIIKKYTLLAPKEEKFQPSKPRKPSELEKEVNPEVLLQQIPEDYDETYLCNALIEFDPKKIIKHYQKMCRKEIVEEGFKNEIVLTCGKLRFGLETGNTIYRNTVASFKPDSKEYNLLKELLEHPNRRRSTERLAEILFPYQKGRSKWKDYQNKVKWFVNSIRKKLEMYGKNPKNKDLFEPCNGYRIKCREK